MNEYKTSKKYALSFIAIMALLLALSTPVSADYEAEDTKMNIYKQGEGDLNYTSGTPFCQCILNYNTITLTNETATFSIDLSHITPKELNKIKGARLYVYWTQSFFKEYEWFDEEYPFEMGVTCYDVLCFGDYGVYPALDVTFNGQTVSFDYAPGTDWIDNYTDAKNIAAVGKHSYESGYVSRNFPSGTNCSTIPVNLLLSGNNIVNVTNVYPYLGNDQNTPGTDRASVCIQGVGLLLTLKEDNKRYWIAEGNDMTNVFWKPSKCKCTLDLGPPPSCTKKHTDCQWSYGINPEDATTKVTFEGPVEKKMSKATLTSVIPTGDSLNNRLYFNSFYNYWGGLWRGNPSEHLSVSETDVSANLCVGEFATNVNVAGFQNGIYPIYPYKTDERQMNVANAFLVVETED